MNDFNADLSNPSPATTRVSDLEWSGKLSRASSNRALFSLLLAMHCQPGNTPISIEKDSETPSTDKGFPERLNHYPRSPLSANDEAILALKVSAQLAQQGQMADLALWNTMHPDPLSAFNDPTHIDSEVKSNCSYATQQSFKHPQSTVLSGDPTQLSELIEQAGDLISA